MPELTTTPQPWPQNAWPTPAELADWLSRCTHDERLSYADHSIATAQRAARCVDIGGQIARSLMAERNARVLHSPAWFAFDEAARIALTTTHHPSASRNDETTEERA